MIGLAALLLAQAAAPMDAGIPAPLGQAIDARDEPAIAAAYEAIARDPAAACALPRSTRELLIDIAYNAPDRVVGGRLILAQAAVDCGADDPLRSDALLKSAADIELAAGHEAQARRLAGRIVERRELIEMLVDRRYAPLWDTLAQSGGPRLRDATAAVAARAERRLAAGRSPEALLAAADAYLGLDDYAAVARVTASFAPDDAALRTIDRDGIWIVNAQASALVAAGRLDEGDRRFAALGAIGLGAHPELIGILINRVGRLADAGAYARALPLVEVLDRLVGSYGNPYAQQLVRCVKARALVAVGRGGEAAPLREAIVAAAPLSPEDAAIALAAMGREDDAARALIDGLAGERRQRVLVALQPDGAVMPPNPYRQPDPFLALRRRADVAAAFGRVGRVLPEALRPEFAAAH